MKHFFSNLMLAGLIGGSVMLAGCASTPADRAVSMSKSVASTGRELEASRTAVTQVLTSLNKLVTQPEGDMRGQYKDYLAAVKTLNMTSDKVDSAIAAMINNSQIYFADWGNQIAAISDTTLKQLSTDRKQQAVASLNDLKGSIEKMRAAYKPLVKDLNDIGTYLGNNLTPSGISAMKPRLDTIKLEAVGVRDAVSAVANSLNNFSSTLSTPAK